MDVELDRWGNDANCPHPDTGCGCAYDQEAVITLDHDDAWALLQFLVGDCETIDVETAKHLLEKLGELFDAQHEYDNSLELQELLRQAASKEQK